MKDISNNTKQVGSTETTKENLLQKDNTHLLCHHVICDRAKDTLCFYFGVWCLVPSRCYHSNLCACDGAWSIKISLTQTLTTISLTLTLT